MSPVDLADPHWFPADYLPGRDRWRMLRLGLDALAEASFLDDRLQASDAPEAVIDAAAVDAAMPAQSPAFVFHTAFCGSTLLARALHSPPHAVALKEPLALLTLAIATAATSDVDERRRLDARLATLLALLGRSWSPMGRTLIKPTNQVNSLIARILALQPGSRAILLHSSLEQFVVSCFEKLPLAETRIRWMAQHLLVGSDLSAKLGIPPRHPFSLPEACVFTWYAQMERYSNALHRDHGDRLRTLDLDTLQASPARTVDAAARWLALVPPAPGQVDAVFRRDAKATGRSYDPIERQSGKALVRQRYGEVIQGTLAWADTTIAPHATLPGPWKPLLG